MESNEEFLYALKSMRLMTCFDVAATSFFIWDYFLTFRMEVDLVWNKQWTSMNTVYLLQRYLPFFDTVGLVLSHQLLPGLSSLHCHYLYSISAVMIVCGFFLSEIILTLRAWAVFNNFRRWAKPLFFFFVAFWSLDLYFVSIFLRSLQFGSHPSPELVGCYVTSASDQLILCWIMVMIWDAIGLSMIMVPWLKAYQSSSDNALLDIVFREGIIHYIYLFILSIINIVVIKMLPADYRNLLTSTERLLHSVLASRVLLHIRSYTANREENWRDEISLIEWDQ